MQIIWWDGMDLFKLARDGNEIASFPIYIYILQQEGVFVAARI